MKAWLNRGVLIAMLMFLAAGLAVVAKPQTRMADTGPKVVLEDMIPRQFGGWLLDNSIIPIEPAPDTQAQLGRIYEQTLSRAYVDHNGRQVMLSIAYGGDQRSKRMTVHRPEVCYAAQGFQIHDTYNDTIETQPGHLPVKRVLAIQGVRVEPITYWITIGDQATIPGIRQKLIQLAFGFSGLVPDGMLIRVSSIGPNPPSASAYKTHEDFIHDLLAALSPEARVRVAGRID